MVGFDTLGEYGEVGGVDLAGEGEEEEGDLLVEGEGEEEDFLVVGEGEEEEDSLEDDLGGGVDVLGDCLVVVVGEFLGVDFLFLGVVCSSSSSVAI